MSSKENEVEKYPKFSKKIKNRSYFFLAIAGFFIFSVVGLVWKQHSLLKSFLSEGNKSLYSGILLESRISAAQEQVGNSVSSKNANSTFVELLKKIVDESKPISDLSSMISPIEKVIESNSPEKVQLTEDLYLSFRNIKAISFNIYRMSWNYKWMNVAKITGQLIGEIDNYTAATGGDALVSNIESKIAQLTRLVTLSQLTTDQKMMIFSQLNGLKTQIQNYSLTLNKTKTISLERKNTLDKVLTSVHSFIQSQSNGMDIFVSKSYTYFLSAIGLGFAFIVLGLIYMWVFLIRYSGSFVFFVNELHRIVKDWLKNQIEKTGQVENIKIRNILSSMPKSFQSFELDIISQILETSLNRVSKLSTETLFISHHSYFPFVLVDASKNAILWNSAFSSLTKNKSKDELGVVHFRTLLTLQDPTGKVVDPFENSEKGEISGKYFLKVGTSFIPVFVKSSSSNKAQQFILIQMMDLRDELLRFESEFDLQIKWIDESIENMKQGNSPALSDAIKTSQGHAIRKQVQKSIQKLDSYFIDLNQKNEILKNQIEVMEKRVSKDSDLKTKTAERIEILSKNIFDLEEKNHVLASALQGLVGSLVLFRKESEKSKQKSKEILSNGKNISVSMNRISKTLQESILKIQNVLGFADRFIATKNYIHQAMEEINVAYANACIISSKKEVNSRDLKSFVDTLNRIHNELGEMNGVFEDSLKEISDVIRILNTDVRKSLATSQGISQQNESILKKVYNADVTYQEEVKELGQLHDSMSEISQINASMQSLYQGFEERIKVLSQIGNASILLHSQVVSGLQDLKGQVDGSNFKG